MNVMYVNLMTGPWPCLWTFEKIWHANRLGPLYGLVTSVTHVCLAREGKHNDLMNLIMSKSSLV